MNKRLATKRYLWLALVALVQFDMQPIASAAQAGVSLEEGLEQLALELTKEIRDPSNLVVAVATFRDVDDQITPLGRYLAMKMPHYLMAQRRFRVVVRRDLDTLLDTLVEEQKDIYDPTTVSKIGKLVGAQGIVLGRVLDLGEQLRVHVWLIDTERRTRLASAAVGVSLDGRLQMLMGQGSVVMEAE